MSQRFTMRHQVVAFVVLVVAVAAAGAVMFRRSLNRGRLDEHLVAVAPFDLADAAPAIWRDALADSVSSRLDRARPLRAVPRIAVAANVARRPDGVPQPAIDATSAARLGQGTGARLVVYGTVAQAGDSVHVTATLLDAVDGKPLGAVEARDEASQMGRLADSLSMRLLHKIAPELPARSQYP